MQKSTLSIKLRIGLFASLFLCMIFGNNVYIWNVLRGMNNESESGLQHVALLSKAANAAQGAQVLFKTQVQEWKNILLRGSDPAAREKYTKAFISSGTRSQEEIQQLISLLEQDKRSTTLAKEVQLELSKLTDGYLKELKQFDGTNPAAIDAAVKGKDRAPTQKLNQIVKEITTLSGKETMEVIAQNKRTRSAANTQQIILSVLALALGSIGAIWIVGSIVRPLNRTVQFANFIAEGNLMHNIKTDRTDELGKLMTAMQAMRNNLHKIVSELRTSSEAISNEAVRMSDSNMHLSARTEQQASTLQETASAMSELTNTVRQSGENAENANLLAVSASDVAIKGGAVVAQVVTTMESISASSKKIVDIISVIDGIAFQTNILALNAAVEAARAGEQGRGFAVVASEVRNLAHRSAAAAKEIKALINDSVQKVESGSHLVSQAGSTMSDIVASVGRVTGIMNEISLASQKQINGIEQINRVINEMDSTTQKNIMLVPDGAEVSALFQDHANQQADLVSRFILDSSVTPTSASHTTSAAAYTTPYTTPYAAATSKKILPARKPTTIATSHPASRPAASRPAPSRPAPSRPMASAKLKEDEWEEF